MTQSWIKLGTLLLASGIFCSTAAAHIHKQNHKFDDYLQDISIDLNGFEKGNFPVETVHLCEGYASIEDQPEDIPPYDENSFEAGAFGMTEAEFRAINAKASRAYSPVVSQLGGNLDVQNLWDRGDVNAQAGKRGSTWTVYMYGGMARLSDVTVDGYTVVLCHEIGHLLAAYPFKRADQTRSGLSSEGNSDYFATYNCFKKLFENDIQENARIAASAPEKAKRICSDAFQDENRKNLCIRGVAAGHNIQIAFHKDRGGSDAEIGKLDPREVRTTNVNHPASQCRENTTTAGALCSKSAWTDATYPTTEGAMNRTSCGNREFSNDFLKGARPRCWFAPNSL